MATQATSALLGRLFLLSAILVSIVAAPCGAQDIATGAAIEDVDDTIDEIVVTGSRIPRKNLVSTSPFTQVNAEEFLYQGVTRVEDLLNDLPQVFPEQHSAVSNGSTGQRRATDFALFSRPIGSRCQLHTA